MRLARPKTLAAAAVALLAITLAVAQVAGEKRGVLRNDSAAQPGYVLFAPMRSFSTYLVDRDGKLVQEWKDKATPGHAVKLLDNGDLVRASRDERNHGFEGGGVGGVIRRFNWDGEQQWEFTYSDEKHCQHHDFAVLPSGNVLLIAWERISRDDAIAAGRKAEQLTDEGVWADHIVEVKPEGERGGTIVWEWHAWDHLIQDADAARPKYGKPGEAPGRIDVNFSGGPAFRPGERNRLRQLGYVGGDDDEDDDRKPQRPNRPASRPAAEPDQRASDHQDARPDGPPNGPPNGSPNGPPNGPGGMRGGPPGMQADWMHTNSIAYNAELDQILLSIHNFHEVWIIDHSTTSAEARTSKGGKAGHGGDILYRWGNPIAWRAGTMADQKLFGQHDAQWIVKGLPGAGDILIFNNGAGRRDGQYSSIEQITPPLRDGKYELIEGKAFAPAKATWQYVADPRDEFNAGHISGAQRLASGNTLICNGESGRIFEVTTDAKVVWDYLSTLGGDAPMGPPPGGRGPGGRFGGPGGGPGGPPMGPPPGGGPGRRGPGGPGGPRGDEKHSMFRATFFAADHPAVKRLKS